MIKKILIAISVVIIVLMAITTTRPSEFTTTREIVIAATPELLFPFINNAKKSYEWMPWAEGDISVEIKFSGPDEGLGAKSSWSGKEMGVGNSEVIESVPNQLVRTKLIYSKPFEMDQVAVVSLAPVPEGTKVKWSVSGKSNFFFRFIGIFTDCDKMVGDLFLKGLNKLKQLAEKK